MPNRRRYFELVVYWAQADSPRPRKCLRDEDMICGSGVLATPFSVE